MENTLSKAYTLTLEKVVFQHFFTYFVFCLISKEQLNTTVCKNSRSPDFQMSNSCLVFKTNNVAKCSEAPTLSHNLESNINSQMRSLYCKWILLPLQTCRRVINWGNRHRRTLTYTHTYRVVEDQPSSPLNTGGKSKSAWILLSSHQIVQSEMKLSSL